MVAAEQHPLMRQPDPVRNEMYPVAEGRWRHTGVAAFLVHLIAGRLDKHRATGLDGTLQRRLDDDGMRRADRR